MWSLSCGHVDKGEHRRFRELTEAEHSKFLSLRGSYKEYGPEGRRIRFKTLLGSQNPSHLNSCCGATYVGEKVQIYSRFLDYTRSFVSLDPANETLQIFLLPFRLGAAATIRMTQRAPAPGGPHETCLGFFVRV